MEIDGALWVLSAIAIAFVVCGCILTLQGRKNMAAISGPMSGIPRGKFIGEMIDGKPYQRS